MSQNFCHLHAHSYHSVLDGFGSLEEMCKEAAELGQPGMAVTDHGTMSGAYELYKAAQKYGIKPIVGLEAYVTPGDLDHRIHEARFFGSGDKENKEERSNDVSGAGAYTHMTLLAENNEGMHNLFRLNSTAFAEGNHRKPRMSVELISKHSKGLIGTTGCPSGELQTRLRLGQWDEAVKYASKMQDILGKENYFLELMDHEMSIDLERSVRGDLMKVAKLLGIPLLATNDLHYVKREQALSHEHMLAIQSGSSMNDLPYEKGGKRFAFQGEEYYVKSGEEMLRYFPKDEYPGALDNTLMIAERCNISFDYDANLRPSVPLPEGHTEDSYLRELAFEGMAKKIPEKKDDPEYIARMNKELDVFQRKNFSGYMLVVSNFMRWAKSQPGWQLGAARGCLSADTNVLTPLGFKKINEIKVGDKVFDQLGNAVTVPQVFEYDCDEELVEISSFYSGESAVKMTADHKVLVSKANRDITLSQSAGGKKYSKEISPVDWIRADEVEVGDLVVMPKIKFPDTLTGFEIDINSTRQENISVKHSSRNISKALGISRNTLKEFILHENRRSNIKYEAINKYLERNNLTVEELVSHRTVTTVLPIDNTIKPDYNMGKLIGIFVSDGWVNARSTEVGFAQKKSEDDGVIPTLFKSIFGIELTSFDSATKDVRQYTTTHKGIVKLFAKLFPLYKQKAHSKYIPWELLNSSEKFRRGMLDGLWYGDGTFKGHTTYTTVSEKLAEGVLTLLTTLGLQAGIYKENRSKDTRQHFNKYDRERSVSYVVTSIPEFDINRIQNRVGAAFDGEYMYKRVRNIQRSSPEGKVYDFTVPTTNSYVTDSFVVHNSGGGSLLAYCIDITEIDPIPHGLIFERFLNPDRDSPPDIDSDFDDIHRPEVIQYVRDTFGEEMVAMIITFGKIKTKNAIKDITRIFDEPYIVGEKLTKLVPPDVAGFGVSLANIYDKEHPRFIEAEEFRKAAASDSTSKRIVEAALGLEGRLRSTGVHAAGVIMSSKPLIDVIPLMTRKEDGVTITQFDYPTCEDLGLIKMDFLGIRNLTVVEKCVAAIKRNHGVEINTTEFYKNVLNEEDPKTYKLLQSGHTLGVFQFDSGGIAALVKSIGPTKFGDISAATALYRPGPMGMNSHNLYADRKNGRAPVIPIHPETEEALAEIVEETYGVIAFQEQVMAIAQKLAGYTLGQADSLRRIMGKKKKKDLEVEFPKFQAGMKANGFSEDAVQTIWNTLIPFAEYGFNKSHSAGYGLLTYLTAYLKANYPAEFMAANLSTLTNDKDKTALYLEECRNIGVKVSPPSVSYSTSDYTATSGSEILVGLKAIRGVGEGVAHEISKEAENGPFLSIDDFVNRVPATLLNKGVLEGLSLAGAFDGLGYSRRTLKDHLPELAKGVVKQKKKEEQGQFSLFDDEEAEAISLNIPRLPEYTKKDKLAFERHVLGLYVSDHPLSGVSHALAKHSDTRIIDIITGEVTASSGFGDRKKIRLAGVVNSVTKKPTKKGEMFAMFSLEDMTGTIPALMFPKTFQRLGHNLNADSIYKMTGSLLQRDGDDVSFSVDEIEEIELTEDGKIPLNLHLSENQVNMESMAELGALLKRHSGDVPVFLHIRKGRKIEVLRLSDEYSIAMEDFADSRKSVRREIMELFGVDSVE